MVPINAHPIIQPALRPTLQNKACDDISLSAPIEGLTQDEQQCRSDISENVPQFCDVQINGQEAAWTAESSDMQVSDDDVSGDFLPEAESPERAQVRRKPSADRRTSSTAITSTITYRADPPQPRPRPPARNAQPMPLPTSPNDSVLNPTWQSRQPPASDFHDLDPDLYPKQQKTRFPEDMYTPKWIRGKNQTKEGWCALCPQGKWLLLKTSAFW